MDVVREDPIHIEGRPGCKVQYGHSSWEDGHEDTVRIYIAGKQGGFSPIASAELAQWGLDVLNRYAMEHLGYTPPTNQPEETACRSL